LAVLLYDFLQETPKPLPMVVGKGLLPVSGKMVLAGAPKSNKSWVAINMALAMARNRPVFEGIAANGEWILPTYKKSRVLYLEQEVGPDGLRNRLGGILAGELDPSIELFIKSRDMMMRLDTEEGRKLIDKEVDEVKPDVTIFDPLAKFHLLDENSAQHMGAIMRAGDKLVEKYGTALIYIHHTGKDPADPDQARRGGNRLRGSSAVFADVDTLVLVDRQGAANAKEPTLKLEFEIRQGEPLDPLYVKRDKNGVCKYLPPHKRFEAAVPVAVAAPVPMDSPEVKTEFGGL